MSNQLWVPVSTSAVQIYTPATTGTPNVTIHNPLVNSTIMYLGGSSSVTASSGLPLYPGQKLTLPFAPAALYAICASGTGGSVGVLTGTY